MASLVLLNVVNFVISPGGIYDNLSTFIIWNSNLKPSFWCTKRKITTFPVNTKWTDFMIITFVHLFLGGRKCVLCVSGKSVYCLVIYIQSKMIVGSSKVARHRRSNKMVTVFILKVVMTADVVYKSVYYPSCNMFSIKDALIYFIKTWQYSLICSEEKW